MQQLEMDRKTGSKCSMMVLVNPSLTRDVNCSQNAVFEMALHGHAFHAGLGNFCMNRLRHCCYSESEGLAWANEDEMCEERAKLAEGHLGGLSRLMWLVAHN